MSPASSPMAQGPTARTRSQKPRSTSRTGSTSRARSPVASVWCGRTGAAARLTTSLAGECARCLRPLTTPIDIVLDEEYLPSLDIATGRPVDATDEPDALRLTDHHELDLEPSISDAISLAEPIAPLDRPDCPGLCVVCGLPLDEGIHDHPDDDIDPRLEALRAFKPD
jgi:uncharacterized protein